MQHIDFKKWQEQQKTHWFLVWWLKHVQVLEYNQSLSPTQVEPPKPPEKDRNIKIPAQNPANPGPKVHHTHNIIHKKICWSHQHGRNLTFPMEFPNSMLFKHPLFPNKSWKPKQNSRAFFLEVAFRLSSAHLFRGAEPSWKAIDLQQQIRGRPLNLYI